MAISLRLQGALTAVDATDAGRRYAKRYGSTGFIPSAITFLDGDGVGRIEQLAVVNFTIANGTTTDYNLRSGITDVLNNAFSLQTLRFVDVYLATVPGAVWFGPQNRTNAAQLWFNGVGSGDRVKLGQRFVVYDPTGWAVGTSTHTIAINNASGASISGTMVLGGVAV